MKSLTLLPGLFVLFMRDSMGVFQLPVRLFFFIYLFFVFCSVLQACTLDGEASHCFHADFKAMQMALRTHYKDKSFIKKKNIKYAAVDFPQNWTFTANSQSFV